MTTITRAEWVEQLRSYKGTKFHHQGRTAVSGVDCIGLLVRAALDLGIAHGADRIKGYPRNPGNDDFNKWAGKFAQRLSYNRLQPVTQQILVGDVMTFWIEKEGLTRHVAVYTGRDASDRPILIHSHVKQAPGKRLTRGVVEDPISTYWRRRISATFRLYEFCEE